MFIFNYQPKTTKNNTFQIFQSLFANKSLRLIGGEAILIFTK